MIFYGNPCVTQAPDHLQHHHGGPGGQPHLLVQGRLPGLLPRRPGLRPRGLRDLHRLPHLRGPQPGEGRAHGLHLPQHAPAGLGFMIDIVVYYIFFDLFWHFISCYHLLSMV